MKPKTVEQLTPTPAREFKKLRKEGVTYALESTGRLVAQRSMPLVRLLMRGEIPDPLTSIAAELIWGQADAKAKKKPLAELVVEMQKLQDWVVAGSLISPVISEEGEGVDEILIEDLLPGELDEIYQNAIDPTKALFPFRDQKQSVESGANGEK